MAPAKQDRRRSAERGDLEAPKGDDSDICNCDLPRNESLSMSGRLRRMVNANPRSQSAPISSIDAKERKEQYEKYENYPLVRSMMEYASVREKSYKCHGFTQFEYPKSNEGWLTSLLVLKGRALDRVAWPWTVVNFHCVFVVCLIQFDVFPAVDIQNATGNWDQFYGFVLNVALSLLLVFRLNRAATRYWLSRQFWGRLVAMGRSIVSGVLVYGDHDPDNRDGVVRWMAALGVITMVFIRGDSKIPLNSLVGILDETSVKDLEAAKHGPIYAADRIRDHLKELFDVTSETSPAIAHMRSLHYDRLENLLHEATLQYGAMERIRGTPLPIVYVAHLRTFLLIHLFLFPYVFGPYHGWATIGVLFVASFALLGIEAASSEVENPFKSGRVNNLNMDSFVLALLQNIEQQVMTRADIEINRKLRLSQKERSNSSQS